MAAKYYYSVRKVKNKGRGDGRDWRWKSFPPKWPFQETKQPDPPIAQEEPAEFEKELLRVANENLSRILHKWHDIDGKLTKNCVNAEDRYKAAKAGTEKEGGEHKEAINNYKSAKEIFYALPLPNIPAKLFWVVFVIITVAEIAFNALVFDVFGQSKIHTYIMAIGLMIAIPWLSDFIGKKLRVEKKSQTTIVLMIGTGLVVFAGLGVIAILREKFFEANKIVEALGIRWDTNSIILTFFVVNIVLFVSVIVLAYEAGHKNPSEYRRLKRNYDKAKKILRSDAKNYEDAAEELANTKIEFNKAHTEREHEYEKIRAKANEERDGWMSLLQIYRAANMEARKDKTKPKSFNTDPEELVKLPDEFQKLDCGSCCYEGEREKNENS